MTSYLDYMEDALGTGLFVATLIGLGLLFMATPWIVYHFGVRGVALFYSTLACIIIETIFLTGIPAWWAYVRRKDYGA